MALTPEDVVNKRFNPTKFREGVPVIVNLSQMPEGDARRLIDFCGGLVSGLYGKIEKVTAKVFLLSPAGIDVTDEDKQRIAAGGFYDQH